MNITVFSYWYLGNVKNITQNRSIVLHKENIHFKFGL